MYLDNNDFVSWMEKLSANLNEIGKDLKSFIQTKDVLSEVRNCILPTELQELKKGK